MEINNCCCQNFFRKHKRLSLLFLTILIMVLLFFVLRHLKSSLDTNNYLIKEEERIATLTLKPDKISIKKGREFEITVGIDTGGRQVNGVDAVIKYDPEFLEVLGNAENGDLFGSLLINDVSPVKGRINLTASRLSKEEKPVEGQGILAKIRFTAKKKGATDISFVFDPRKTNTSNVIETVTSKNLLTHTENCNVEIEE